MNREEALRNIAIKAMEVAGGSSGGVVEISTSDGPVGVVNLDVDPAAVTITA